MLQALFLSLRQLGDPPIVRVFLKSLGLTLALFAALVAGIGYGAHWAAARYFGWGEGTANFAAFVAMLAMVAAAWLLFRAVAIAVIGIFGDEIVHAVEARHYPGALKNARPVPFARSLAMGFGSAGRAVLVNLIASPLYLVLLVTGIGTPIAFFLVNAWLLGRDLGDMVAARHMPGKQLASWRGLTRILRFSLGAIGTGLFFVPFVNLIAPVLGAAMATHMFHRRLG
jgi:uncharacterized protein involved in cysteine biosynthesis